MLSSEGSILTRLILARQTLVCRAIELDLQFEVLALVESMQDACSDAHTATDARTTTTQSRKELSAELSLLPERIEDLDRQIERAWHRLDRVSPRTADWSTLSSLLQARIQREPKTQKVARNPYERPRGDGADVR